ncbi:MAG: 16S rRNA processing protein RimM [Bacteroidales bacterium]|nr:16S rRNA processing protein RimM [Bacteroidales bacterium]
MKKDDCFYFGKVIKTHGIKGEISIRIDSDNPSDYSDIKFILLEINNKLIPFFIDSLKINQNKAYVAIQDMKTIEGAMELVGYEIYLPLDQLPKLIGNKFYYHEVPGFKVIDKTYGLLGTIDRVLEYPNQAVFQVFYKDKEVLIPIQDEVILKLNRKTKTFEIDAPEGLIDLYLNS